MAPETVTTGEVEHDEFHWIAGLVGGLLAGVVFGLLIQFMLGAMPAIGALYGAPGVVTGWIAHLFHSAVFGLTYAAIAEFDPFEGYADDWLSGAGLGVGYGVAVWAIFLVFVWPIWLDAVGFPMAPAVPYLNPMPLVGHVVFGAILGGVYAIVR